MAVSAVESNSYASGGANSKMDIHREVTITGTLASDFAAAATITAAALNLTKVVQATTVMNSTGQAIDLVPNFAQTAYICFPKGTYTLTDLVFKGMVYGR